MNKVSTMLILFVAVIAMVMLAFLDTYITQLHAYLISTFGRGWYALGMVVVVILSILVRRK